MERRSRVIEGRRWGSLVPWGVRGGVGIMVGIMARGVVLR
jgi:hypothetical protein